MNYSTNSNYEGWRRIIEKWRTSGLSQSKFCAANNLTYSQFKYFLYRLRDIDMSQKALLDMPKPPETKEHFEPIKLVQSKVTSMAKTCGSPPQAVKPNEAVFRVNLVNGLSLDIPTSCSSTSLKTIVEVLKQC